MAERRSGLSGANHLLSGQRTVVPGMLSFLLDDKSVHALASVSNSRSLQVLALSFGNYQSYRQEVSEKEDNVKQTPSPLWDMEQEGKMKLGCLKLLMLVSCS